MICCSSGGVTARYLQTLVFCVTCYEATQAVVTSIQVVSITNVQAVARDISPSLTTTQTKLITHAKQCIQPGLEY